MNNLHILGNKRFLLLVFMATFSGMFCYEWTKEFFLEGKLTPWQDHTITIFFTSIVTTIVAAIVRKWALTVAYRQQALEAKEKSLESFQLLLSATNHIVNNVLNWLKVIQIDIERYGEIKPEHLQELEKSMAEANQQMAILNQIQHPSDPKSYKDIYPR